MQNPHRILPCCSTQRVRELRTWGSGNNYVNNDDDNGDDDDIDKDDDDDTNEDGIP